MISSHTMTQQQHTMYVYVCMYVCMCKSVCVCIIKWYLPHTTINQQHKVQSLHLTLYASISTSHNLRTCSRLPTMLDWHLMDANCNRFFFFCKHNWWVVVVSQKGNHSEVWDFEKTRRLRQRHAMALFYATMAVGSDLHALLTKQQSVIQRR